MGEGTASSNILSVLLLAHLVRVAVSRADRARIMLCAARRLSTGVPEPGCYYCLDRGRCLRRLGCLCFGLLLQSSLLVLEGGCLLLALLEFSKPFGKVRPILQTGIRTPL